MGNRRSFSRVPLVGFVDIKMVDRNLRYTGFIEQISRGGIGIYTKDKIRSGGRVDLELLCFVGNDTLNSSISGTVKSCGGIVSSLKKNNELKVVACLIEHEAKQKQKRRGLLRLI